MIVREKELYHYGVKGMKWGVRRQARKDAKEYARAKMFYGEGAGTRRKLISNTVKQRSKDPEYKKEFDKALASQDMAKHATKAKHERKRKDVGKATAKTGRGIINIVAGHPERLGASMATAYSVYYMAHKAGVDKAVADTAKRTFSEAYGYLVRKHGAAKLKRMLG